MRASRVGRNVAVVGMSLALGAVEARAQTVVPSCEQLLVLRAGSTGGPNGTSVLVLGVARELGPGRGGTRLVLGPSDEGFLCVPAAREVAVGTSRVELSGENVYIRGFGSFVIKLRPKPRP